MRFVDRSHREGPLGSVFNDDGDDLGGVRGHLGSGNLLDQFPLLPEVLGLSKPEETHYMPGDPDFQRLAETVPTSRKLEPRAKKQPAPGPRGENSPLRSTPQVQGEGSTG